MARLTSRRATVPLGYVLPTPWKLMIGLSCGSVASAGRGILVTPIAYSGQARTGDGTRTCARAGEPSLHRPPFSRDRPSASRSSVRSPGTLRSMSGWAPHRAAGRRPHEESGGLATTWGELGAPTGSRASIPAPGPARATTQVGETGPSHPAAPLERPRVGTAVNAETHHVRC